MQSFDWTGQATLPRFVWCALIRFQVVSVRATGEFKTLYDLLYFQVINSRITGELLCAILCDLLSFQVSNFRITGELLCAMRRYVFKPLMRSDSFTSCQCSRHRWVQDTVRSSLFSSYQVSHYRRVAWCYMCNEFVFVFINNRIKHNARRISLTNSSLSCRTSNFNPGSAALWDAGVSGWRRHGYYKIDSFRECPLCYMCNEFVFIFINITIKHNARGISLTKMTSDLPDTGLDTT